MSDEQPNITAGLEAEAPGGEHEVDPGVSPDPVSQDPGTTVEDSPEPVTLTIPTSEDDKEGWAQLWNQLGRPEKPEDYGIEAPENLPEGMTFDKDFMLEMAKVAHEAGVPKKQFEALIKAYSEREINRHNEIMVSADKQAEQIREQFDKMWGRNLEANMKIAGRTFAKFADKETQEYFRSRPELATDPVIAKLFYQVGKALEPDSIQEAVGATGHAGASKEAINQQIDKFRDVMRTAQPGSKEWTTAQQELVHLYNLRSKHLR